MREAGRTAEISASRREDLGESFRLLPGFLAELEPYMGRLGDLTEAQTPVLRDLQSPLGRARHLPHAAPPVRGGGPPRPSTRSARCRVVGRRAVRKTTRPRSEELRQLAKDAPGLAKPLRQFLQTIDDRGRAVEPDARAAASGPPAGDKTHTTSNRAGFTGMEAIWNFFYWQALTTNPLDDLGHVLRLSVLVNPCTPYSVKPSEELHRHLQPVPRPDAAGRHDPRPDRGERCRRD